MALDGERGKQEEEKKKKKKKKKRKKKDSLSILSHQRLSQRMHFLTLASQHFLGSSVYGKKNPDQVQGKL